MSYTDIRVTPLLVGKVHPAFLNECTRALGFCNNLHSFVYTPASVAINAILPTLEKMEHLKTLRLCAKLSTSQTASLLKLNKIEKLELDNTSWEVLDVLPRWVEGIRTTLTSLTIYLSMELNVPLLEMVLKQLPRLQGLHILCPNIDHIKILTLVVHTPLLESLAFSITETAQPPELPSPPPTLSMLRHLALNVRAGLSANPAIPNTLLGTLTALKAGFANLSSVVLKIPEFTIEASHATVTKLVKDHAGTIERLFFINSGIEMKSVAEICEKCRVLGVLSMPLPMREIFSFASALAPSQSLHTLVDGGGHIAHGSRPALNHKNVAVLMQRVTSLARILDDKRLWTVQRDARGHVRVALERQTVDPSAQWFMPHT
ncbi:hypothetical protein C0991_000358 [Blastosporella zonata]|nr:hypothetical protein C0991_000358 [Blastosporella zonata]